MGVESPQAPLPPQPAQLPQRRPSSFTSDSADHEKASSHHSHEDDQSTESINARPSSLSLGPVLSRVVTSGCIIVPRKKRRGLFASLCLIPEVDKPYKYARVTKRLITMVISLAGAAAPMASAILFPALGPINKEFNSSQTITNLSVALYMLGMAIFPLWWSSFSERVGYRTILLSTFTLYAVANVACALSVNIGMFIALRVVSGAAAASAQTVGAGNIAAIYEVRERGRAMGIFYLGPLMGPLIGPLIGGGLTARFGWRSLMWFLAAFGGIITVLILFTLPEVFRKPTDNRPMAEMPKDVDGELGTEGGLERTLSRVSTKAKRRVTQWATNAKILLVDPLRSLKFVRFPPVLITVYWASFAFGALYILNVSIQKTFAAPPYNFSTTIIGLMYIPNSVGYLVTSVTGGRWNDVVMRRAAERRRENDTTEDVDAPLNYLPEDRMGINAWVAGAMFPLALIWYGWAVEKGTFWLVSMISTFIFGIGSMLVFSIATTMLTEFVPGRSASAVAVNNFFRNICSCVGGIVGEPLIEAIGNGWLFTIICGVGLVSCGCVWMMQRWGPKWREEAREGKYPFLFV